MRKWTLLLFGACSIRGNTSECDLKLALVILYCTPYNTIINIGYSIIKAEVEMYNIDINYLKKHMVTYLIMIFLSKRHGDQIRDKY